MTAKGLHIGYLGEAGYAVFEGRTQISGRFGNFDLATTRMDNILKARRTKRRPCLCCGTPMKSTGPGHRLCDPCREQGSNLGLVA